MAKSTAKREMVEAWELLRDAGPAGCQTPNDMLTVLAPLQRALNYRDVAGCLALIMRTFGDQIGGGSAGSLRSGFASMSLNNGPPNPSSSLMLGKKGGSSNWNIDVFVDIVPKSMNWDLALRSLDDFPDLKIKSQEVFNNVLVSAYKRGTKQNQVPGNCFLGLDWAHPDVQATLLMHALNTEEVRFEPTVDGGRDTKWSCVALVETLLRLAERGHHAIAHAALQLGRATDPDSLLLSLLWTKPSWDQLREELYAALVPPLLVRAMEDEPEAIRVLGNVWTMNRELVVRGVLEALQRDASVLDLIFRLPDGLGLMLSLPHRVSLPAACAAFAKDPSFKLEKWLTDRLASLKPDALVASVRETLKFIETRQLGPNTKASPKLSRTCMAVLFRAIQAVRPPEMAQEIKRVLDLCRDSDPQLMSGAGQPAQHPQQLQQEIEDSANATFQLIFSGSMDMDQVIGMLGRMKESEDRRERDIFECMINNLFDEYRFFTNYPDKELRITGILFGSIVQHQLGNSWQLNMAIKYVLDSLRRPPTTPNDAKIFKFGVVALEQFKTRLPELPHVINDLLAIPFLAEAEPKLHADIERAKAQAQSPAASPASQASVTQGTSGLGLPSSVSLPLSMVDSLEIKRAPTSADVDAMSAAGMAAGIPTSTSGGLGLRGHETPEAYGSFCLKLDQIIGGPSSEDSPPSPDEQFEDQWQFLINNLTKGNVEEKVAQAKKVLAKEHFAWTANFLIGGRVTTQQNFHSLYMQFLDMLGEKQLMYEVRQRTLVYIKKLLKSSKIVTSTNERSALKNLGSWLGQLTLAKNKPLLQREVDLKELLMDGYERGWLIAVVPFAAKVLEGAQNSKVFTATNPWMSAILGVLAEIYRLPDVKLNLKFEMEVLFRYLGIEMTSYSPSSLLQFRLKPKLSGNPDFNIKNVPPAPAASTGSLSTSGLTSAFAAPSLLPGQQAVSVQAGGAQQQMAPLSFPQQSQQQGLGFQQQFGGPMFPQPHEAQGQLQPPQPQRSSSSAAPQQQQPTHGGLAGAGGGVSQGDKGQIPDTMIPNLSNYVFINTQLAFFAKHPELKRVVPLAVDRAIREIIQPAVERSVAIACITTRELVLKDFAMEPRETRLIKAAHLMVSNLAGALALVTCKELLRMSMGNHLRALLTGFPAEDAPLIDQVVTTCSAENLELGCLLIEKAATDKAMRDIDEALEPAVAIRKDNMENAGEPYFDMSIFSSASRFPAALPPVLRPRPQESGLSNEQLAVYEAFQKPPRPAIAQREGGMAGDGLNPAPPVSPAPLASGGSTMLPSGTVGAAAAAGRAGLTASQALERYKAVVASLDIAVQKLLQQPGFHDLPTSALPSDNEVIQQLNLVRSIVAATVPDSRFEVAVMIAQSVFKRLFDGTPTDKLRLSVQVGALEAVSLALDGIGLRGKITEWVLISIANGKLNVSVTTALVDAQLVGGVELDALLADLLEGQLSATTCAFALELVQRCVVQSRTWLVAEASRTLTVLRSVALGATSLAAPPGLARLLADVADIAVLQQTMGGAPPVSAGGYKSPAVGTETTAMPSAPAAAAVPPPSIPMTPFVFTRNPAIDATARKDVEVALQRWIVVSRDGGSASQFLSALSDKGLLKGDKQMERFFYLCTELCVESFLTIVSQPLPQTESNQTPGNNAAAAEETARSRLAYTGVDSYGVLVSLFVKYADHRVRPTVAAMVLEAISKVMNQDVTARYAQGHEATFDQRPYFRMILNFQRELLSIPSSAPVPLGANDAELAESADKLLAVFAEAHHHYFSPERAPGFCFAWLELISHHSFMPRLLREERGWSVLHRLLIDLLVFMEPFLRTVQLTPAVRALYKGTLRVLLVLLHDFPEFLCFFHFSLCNVIPPTCVQLRNLILSAFPRTMRLPDPFTPNLKVDLLPEISVHPRILSDYTAPLEQALGGNLRADVDLYLRTGNQPANFLSSLKDRVRGNGSNWAALNALVLHVGVVAITWMKIAAESSSGSNTQQQQQQLDQSGTYIQGAKEIFQTLATDLDAEARYQYLNAIANHLRYPNSHTHYFSCVILGLFKEGSEVVQEQVTRVLLERLIVHRPHPWGLLVTFIELMKNPRYAFWDHGFTRCTPEIHKVFESVAASCGAVQPTTVGAA